jgi:tetratricopeptide (TPR) repeat protein
LRPFLCVLLLLASCRKAAEPGGRQRLAVLPFDNLTPDAQSQWFARAGHALATEALSGSKLFLPMTVSAAAQAPAVNASRALHGYLTMEARGPVVHLWVEDLASHEMVKTVESSAGGVAESLAAALKSIAPDAAGLPNTNLAALSAWGNALGSRDPREIATAAQQSIAADPDFGQAWILHAQAVLASGNRDEARSIAEQAVARQSLRGSRERAQLEVLAATLKGDDSGRVAALEKLAAAQPDDAATLEALADMQVRRSDYKGAIATYSKAAQAPSVGANVWNTLGYLYGRVGDLPKAKEALDKYRTESRDVANANDSLGEIHFSNGDFAKAAPYFDESFKANPRAGIEVWKSAFALYLAGDAGAAQKKFEEFLALKPGAIEERRAQWDYLNGRRKEALARADQLSAANASPFAHVLSIQWNLEAGNRAAAEAAFARLIPVAQGPWGPVAQVCAVMLNKKPAQTPVEQGYAAIFSRDYRKAAEIWKQIGWGAGSVSVAFPQGLARVAASAAGSNERDELYPVPPTGLDQAWLTLVYPQFLAARGVKDPEAKKRFEQYRGQGPNIWEPAR